MTGRLGCLVEAMLLFYFLLQFSEDLRVEKIDDGNIQTVAQLFYCGNGGAVISPAGDIVYCRLSDAAESAQLVHCDAPVAAKLQYSVSYRIPNCHIDHPNLNELRQDYPFHTGKITSFELIMQNNMI